MSEKTNQTKNTEIQEWDDPTLNLRPNLLRGIYAFGFEKPSPIQAQAIIPIMMALSAAITTSIISIWKVINICSNIVLRGVYKHNYIL